MSAASRSRWAIAASGWSGMDRYCRGLVTHAMSSGAARTVGRTRVARPPKAAP